MNVYPINMKSYNFEVTHGYQILKGYLDATSKKKAIEKIKKEEWNCVIDEFDTDNYTEGCEIINLWEG